MAETVNDATAPTELADEAKALSDIVTWSEACCAWQRDALRRLCLGSLNDGDIGQLLTICKGASVKTSPFTSEHVRDAKSSGAVVNLIGVHDVENVNALATGEHLTFFKSGVTVVYGDNGSGKSGYIRILKKVCRARAPKDDKIVPNIYASVGGPQKAVVDYSVNGENRDGTWATGKPAPSILSAVSVFDCHTANVHVDQTNDVAYTPFPMKILEGLAQACLRIKERLAAEIEAIEKRTPLTLKRPECKPHTKVGILLQGLTADTKPATVQELANLSTAESARHEALKTDLASDPAKVARALQAQKTRFDGAVSSLARLHASIADGKASALVELHKRYEAARGTARIAAGTLFTSEPLPQIGSDVWRGLWEAARAYSQEQAYPSEPFPYTGADAVCVLCQQTLDEKSAARLTRFEQFIKDESKKQEKLARDNYEAGLKELQDANMAILTIRAGVAILRDELGDGDLAALFRKSGLTAKLRHRRILRTHKLGVTPVLPTPDAPPAVALTVCGDGLGARATALLTQGQSEERKKMIAESEELADRGWLSLVREDVIAEIGRRKEIAALKLAQKDTATNRITAKSAEIAEDLVTNALRAQFTKEIARLGVGGLAIELRNEKSSYGTPFFRVTLIKKPEIKVAEILSEGEHRCVAIAAFLAELATTESHSAVVFDDPVSSLDHMHREALAERFAAEGQQRQVIIFTHDIAFLFLVNEACRAQETPIGFRCITRGSELTGYCQQNPPPNAQPVDKVIESMQKQLDNQKIQHERGQQEDWYRTVRSLQEQLRTTWERAVEEAVAPVIKRLANKVHTPGLSKLTAIALEDCKTMRAAFGRCSQLLHSAAEVLNPPLPAPAVIQSEIDTLRTWVVQIKDRQDKIDDI